MAEAVADALRDAGARVEVRPAAEVGDLDPYDAVVLGSPLYGMEVLPDAAAFLQRHAAALRELPVAEFTLSMTVADDTEGARRRVLGSLARLESSTRVRPVGVGLFGGVIEKRRLRPLDRLHAILKREPDYDHRDWRAIRAWAAGIAPLLLSSRTAPEGRPTAGATAPRQDQVTDDANSRGKEKP